MFLQKRKMINFFWTVWHFLRDMIFNLVHSPFFTWNTFCTCSYTQTSMETDQFTSTLTVLRGWNPPSALILCQSRKKVHCQKNLFSDWFICNLLMLNFLGYLCNIAQPLLSWLNIFQGLLQRFSFPFQEIPQAALWWLSWLSRSKLNIHFEVHHNFQEACHGFWLLMVYFVEIFWSR